MIDWNEAQKHEKDYWMNCLGLRAWGEFTKQEMYGREMGLFAEFGRNMTGDLQGELDMQGKSVLDVGGGPVSMTLRCINAGPLVVVDPCDWPPSVARRYRNYGVTFIQASGEELAQYKLPRSQYDEVWVYNVLQHVVDPAAVVENAILRIAPGGKLRIFEWLWIETSACHPHYLTPENLTAWLQKLSALDVRLPRLKEFWSDATAFVGVFQ